ncbi:MAG TPA: hypothetical protein VFE32_17640 [Puia sp.]|nr:hypothetical protein [Puia sp.]
MKTGFYFVFYSIISNGAIVLCFIPFIFLGWRNIRKIRTWWVLGIYWLLNGVDNLLEILPASHASASHAFVRELSIGYTLMETPLLLLAFAFARQGRTRKGLLLLLVLFLAGETLLIRLRGNGALALIIGSGLAIIILYSLTGLLDYVKKMEHTRFENSMVFIYASLLFFYGSMLIIYIFAHFRHAGGTNGNDADSFLLYYVSLLLSAAITCAGLWSYGIRRSRPRSWSAVSGYSSSSS